MAAKGRRIKRRGSGRSSCEGDEGLLQPQQPQQAQQVQQQQQQAAAAGGPSTQTEPSTVSGNSVSEGNLADGAENARMHQLLEAQKRAFEVGRTAPVLTFFVAKPSASCSWREAVPPACMSACMHVRRTAAIQVACAQPGLSACMWLFPQARLEEGRKSVSDLARQMLGLQVLPHAQLPKRAAMVTLLYGAP